MTSAPRTPAELKQQLREELGPDVVLFDAPSLRRHYARDLAEIPQLMRRAFFQPVPDLVVQPTHPDQVEALMRYAVAHGVPVTPRGAGSSGFWGSVPTCGGISLDLSPMDAIESIDPEQRIVTVQAGAKWHDVDRAVGHQGLTLFTSPSSRYSTVAGWVATGGYGMDGFRYGHLSEHIESIEVVTPEDGGTVVSVGPADEAYERYSGTEGQLGVITRVTLKLRERPTRHRSFLALFDEPERAFELIDTLAREDVPALHVIFLDQGHMHELNEVHRARGRSGDIVPEKDAVLFYFDDVAKAAGLEGQIAKWVEQHQGTLAERHVANLLFNDRFLPLKAKKLGPQLMGAQVVLDVDRSAAYLRKARALCRRYRAAFSVESHIIRTKDGVKSLMMAIVPVSWRGAAGHFMYLSLAGLLTYAGIRMGGRPYSLGVWNIPFRRLKWDSETYRRIKDSKARMDPRGVMNPWKFPTVRSKFFGLPALMLRPAPYRLLMALTAVGSVLMSWLGLPRLLGRKDTGRIDEAAPLQRSADECTYCGACQPVCPAWLVTRDERVVARSKLQLALRMRRGDPVDPEEANMAFVCLHCGECTRVCQAILPLVPVWDELEANLVEQFGYPREKVDTFLADLATNEPFQRRLLEHEPTLYSAMSATRTRVELPLKIGPGAITRNEDGSRAP